MYNPRYNICIQSKRTIIYIEHLIFSIIFHSNKKETKAKKLNSLGLYTMVLAWQWVGRLPCMFLIEEWSNTLNKKVACEVVPLGSTFPHLLILFQVWTCDLNFIIIKAKGKSRWPQRKIRYSLWAITMVKAFSLWERVLSFLIKPN